MKKQVFENVKNYVLDTMSIDEIKSYKSKWYYPIQLVQDGFFSCYYSQALEDLETFYWENFDKTRYFTKKWDLKYKNGEVYARTIYKNMLAYVMNKMID